MTSRYDYTFYYWTAYVLGIITGFPVGFALCYFLLKGTAS